MEPVSIIITTIGCCVAVWFVVALCITYYDTFICCHKPAQGTNNDPETGGIFYTDNPSPKVRK